MGAVMVAVMVRCRIGPLPRPPADDDGTERAAEQKPWRALRAPQPGPAGWRGGRPAKLADPPPRV